MVSEEQLDSWRALHLGTDSSQMTSALEEVDIEPKDAFNVDLLRETVQWAKKSMEVEEPFGMRWYQGDWLTTSADVKKAFDTDVDSGYQQVVVAENFCNTAGCIAGNIAMMKGEPVWIQDKQTGHLSAEYVEDEAGNKWSVERFAKSQLGITRIEADLLFSGGNSYQRIEKLAEAFCLRRGLTF